MEDQNKNLNNMKRVKTLNEELIKYYVMIGALAAFIAVVFITNP
jgi:hypothetical protein